MEQEYYRPEMLRHLPQNTQKVLDVGCADGYFGLSVKQWSGAEVWGVEMVPSIAEKAVGKLDKILVGLIDDSKTLEQLPEGYFDAIFFNDVIEHLVDPEALLLKIKSKLSPQGVIVSAIPNVRHFRTLRNLIFKKDWEYEEYGVLAYSHLRFYTQKSIQRMFKKLNFEILFFEGANATKSVRPYLYNILTFGLFGLDTRFLHFVSVVKPNKK